MGRQRVSWGISSLTWIRASVSSWTVCGDTWRHRIHRYKTSPRFSIWFRSGEREDQSMTSIRLSSRNCLHTLAACHMCSVWTCSHLWRERVTSGWSNYSGVFWRLLIEPHGSGLWGQVPLKDVEHSCCPHGVCFWQFVLKPVACWRSFFRAPPVPPSTKEQIPVLLLGWCPSTALSSSPCLLVSPLCSWDCAGSHSKPSCEST